MNELDKAIGDLANICYEYDSGDVMAAVIKALRAMRDELRLRSIGSAMIDSEFIRILSVIAPDGNESCIFGEPVKRDDTKAMVVAAYHAGIQDGLGQGRY